MVSYQWCERLLYPQEVRVFFTAYLRSHREEKEQAALREERDRGQACRGPEGLQEVAEEQAAPRGRPEELREATLVRRSCRTAGGSREHKEVW